MVIEACRLLASWAVFLQCAELLWLSKNFGATGVWNWRTLSREYSGAKWVMGWVFGDRSFKLLLLLQAVLAIVVGFGVPSWPASIAMAVIQVAIAMRFRGSFYGGSDSMLCHVLLGLALGPDHERLAVAWIASLALISYAVAGWVKVMRPEWRSGRALAVFAAYPQYSVPMGIQGFLKSPKVSLGLAWSVMGFELGFVPVVLSGSKPAAAVMLGAGVLFHLSNVWVFGLNRFFWAWIATYPALAYWAGLF